MTLIKLSGKEWSEKTKQEKHLRLCIADEKNIDISHELRKGVQSHGHICYTIFLLNSEKFYDKNAINYTKPTFLAI